MTKTLREIIELLPGAVVSGDSDITIQDIHHDSRALLPGGLFVCISGATVDGHAFLQQAKERGALAALVEREIEAPPEGLTLVRVADTRAAAKKIAPFFFDYPAKKMRMVGITGTNGKTTTTYLLKSILNRAGYKVGVIGTIQNIIGERKIPTNNSTPDVIDLQRLLAEMSECAVDYVVMEVSSHALELDRVAGCEFDAAVFTNMTQDHLDFHHTFENYLAAKQRLFSGLSEAEGNKRRKTAIVNIDDPAGAAMKAASAVTTLSYGLKQNADFMALETDVQASGTRFVLQSPLGRETLQLKITGFFNVYNVLGAIAAASAEEIPFPVIKEALEEFVSVSGRFELVDGGQDFSVIVDYAHTPDGLENILQTAKQIAKRRIIVVFGCGGDRDRTKRPIMGGIAARYGDIVIVTSDNPRSENPALILEEIEVGIKEQLSADKVYEKIADRRQAIGRAIELAMADDLVIIAGKGHEDYQILNTGKIHFDDKEVALEWLKVKR
ncbi:UDP-N-acetylmuramoyl-L-alanyl-D-glutamate--2,6-diaminopimelate ligase [Azotosporobacter soli]|uniref:UDP-N-acetylmuramoyl-L-alanyl-D-glutamate--2, 6-diaminopimelate ligase n=1 Tax=Azotosporobacter soli TaxID=3055040 RepID=UPI0031FE7E4C